MILATAITAFLKSREAIGCKQTTLTHYTRVLGEYGQVAPSWPPKVEEMEDFLVKKRATCKEMTVYSMFLQLKAFFNWCELRGLISDNPVRLVGGKPRKPKILPKVIHFKKIKAFFDVLQQAASTGESLPVRDYALFRLAYDTGARISELSRMQLDDLDLEEGSLMIRGSKSGDRMVYFGPGCERELRRWLSIHPGGDWLFTSRSPGEAGRLTRNGIYQAMRRWADAAGVNMTVHRIRHSYATHSLRQGIDLGYISAQLGHSDIATTAIYLACDDEGRQEAHRVKAPGERL